MLKEEKMEKKKLMAKDEIKRFIKENNIKDIAGIEESLKRMFSSVIEEMLEAELEDQLGCSKYDYKSKTTDNSRNGRTKKTVMSKYGEAEIEVPGTGVPILSVSFKGSITTKSKSLSCFSKYDSPKSNIFIIEKFLKF